MDRTLQPELLDSLSPDNLAARHSRRDLLIINRIMGNERWFRRELRLLLRPGERILELGAGTGELGAALAASGVAADGLDLWPRPPNWPRRAEWHRADLRHFDGYGEYPAVIANLVLHHFSAAELSVLGAQLAGARLIVASEPARWRRSQVLFAAFGPLLGANHVTCHDAHVSIAAGFLEDELPRTLGLTADRWQSRCGTSPLGAYRMIAWRR